MQQNPSPPSAALVLWSLDSVTQGIPHCLHYALALDYQLSPELILSALASSCPYLIYSSRLWFYPLLSHVAYYSCLSPPIWRRSTWPPLDSHCESHPADHSLAESPATTDEACSLSHSTDSRSSRSPLQPPGLNKLLDRRTLVCSPVSEIVITYFPVRGRAEALRLLLADQGISWREDEVQMQDWFSGKGDMKKNAVFGQLPRLQDGSFELYQSNSILRYLGRKYGIAGSNEHEKAIVEMVNDGVEDLRMKYYKFYFIENEANKDKYLEEVSKQLCYFEKILSKNGNGTKFLVGDGITYADYNLVDTLQCNLDLSPTCLSAFPLLSAYQERVLKRPKLSEYLKSDGRKRRPITPKHK
ncbi:PREDICTED: glutathione S-transferase P 1-like [Nanorana parkeri]|uniref:glutathione S-transferase P 1-like n=1 Tax=Nanorana parkeri TaxID=125878 RepID=UPI000854BB44|nr:PREDICTED: glutathione S-transferase P 1-like [Nanorana parkeri]